MNLKTLRNMISPRKTSASYETDHTTLFLAMGPDPLGYADAHLKEIGDGGAATLFAHPDDPELVVRVSRPHMQAADGWVQYAATLRDAGVDPKHNYGPVLLDVVHIHGTFVSVTPKLTPLNGDGHGDLARAARKLIDPDRHGEITADERTVLLKNAPGFDVFAADHLERASDLGLSNFMMDGRRLIVNDPIPTMDPDFAAEMIRKHDISTRAPEASLCP